MAVKLGVAIKVAICCAVATSAAVGSAVRRGPKEVGAAEVIAVNTVHRHGARFTVPPANASTICGTNCGQLTRAGEEMLFSLGQTLRSTYPHIDFGDSVSRKARDTDYNPDRVVSHSTNIDRTLQSASALVRGVMAPLGSTFTSGASDVLPVVHTTEIMNAKMLLPADAAVNVFYRAELGLVAEQLAELEAYAASLFTDADLHTIGSLLGMEGLCQPNSAAGGIPIAMCAIGLEDNVTSSLANGWSFEEGLLLYFNRSMEVLRKHNDIFFFSFNETAGSFDRMSGAQGYLLAKAIGSNFVAPSVAPLTDYSGHDVTVMPLSYVFGVPSAFVNAPAFAGTYVVELLSHGNVRVAYGEPQQLYGTNHTYNLAYIEFLCETSADEQYIATAEEGCPLADWQRHVDALAPQSPAADCYLSEHDLAASDCVPGNSSTDAAGVPPTPGCAFYRRSCPVWACRPPGATATAAPSHYLSPQLLCVAFPHDTVV